MYTGINVVLWFKRMLKPQAKVKTHVHPLVYLEQPSANKKPHEKYINSDGY